MSSQSGGGAAANSGVNFQQRVSAWLLASSIAELPIAKTLGLRGETTANTISYEHSGHIDDLKVIWENGQVSYFQIKRALSLSTRPESEFSSAVDQFVRQFIADASRESCYVLAVSSDASGSIRRILRKLLDATRLNPNAMTENPHSKAEADVNCRFHEVVRRSFAAHAIQGMTKDELAEFSRRTYIYVVDVEEGMPHESSAILALAPRVHVPPELVWSLLVKNQGHRALWGN